MAKQNENKFDNRRPVKYAELYDDNELDGRDFLATKILEEEVETFTGLYDAQGRPLHRQRERIGFLK